MEDRVKTDVAALERWFLAYEEVTNASQVEATRARDYKDGNQLTSEEKQTLKQRGQPPVVMNRVRRKIDWLQGLEIKQRTDPKAFPRTPQHEQDAEAVTDAIRFVCDSTDWDTVRTSVYENMLVEGYGGCEVVHETDRKGRAQIKINHYPWDRLWYDPHSRADDFSDARHLGAVIWMDEAEFKRQFPKADVTVENMFASHGSEAHEDKPDKFWVDTERKRIRVILCWYLDKGVWSWCKFVKGQKLEGGESPYVDEDGASMCPLILQSANVGRNNDRYGIVRDMFDPQDEINKRRSKALHSINSRQTIGIKGAVDSVVGLKRELAKPDGHVEVNVEAFEDAARAGMKPFDVLGVNDQTSAQFELLREAKEEIDLLGANAALAGETGESASGRAVLARQQGGMVEIAALMDRLHRFTRRVYEHIWARIRQFWTEERWVRVTDDERNVRFVGLNKPVTLMDALSGMPPEQVQQVAMQYGLRPNDPRLSQPIGIQANVAEIEVDIVIEEVPDRVTLQGEAFEALMKYGPAIPPAVLIEADPSLPVAKKEKLLEALKQPPAPTPKEQVELAQGEAEVAKTMAEAQQIQTQSLPLAHLG